MISKPGRSLPILQLEQRMLHLEGEGVSSGLHCTREGALGRIKEGDV
jgi:hypothetical protein